MAQKCNITSKTHNFLKKLPFWGTESGFWKKVKKNNGGLLSAIFSKNHSKCLKMAISWKFSDFRKWPVAQKRRGKFFCRKEKFVYTYQRLIWHAADLCSPSESALKLHLPENDQKSWFYYVKWAKTLPPLTGWILRSDWPKIWYISYPYIYQPSPKISGLSVPTLILTNKRHLHP